MTSCVCTVSFDDFGRVSGQTIQFNTGDTNQTHAISITQDQLCESDPNEFIFSNIALASGIPSINVIQPQARITIDDSMEPECGKGNDDSYFTWSTCFFILHKHTLH